ncbi:hypothetical protein BH10PSE17_BH10PSE17_25570 [soil metagenome]
MRYELVLPRIIADMADARIETVHVAVGEEVEGGRLLDISIDLGQAAALNCPPISYYRLVTREKVRLLELRVAPGGRCEPGAAVAVFGDGSAIAADEPMARPLRLTVAAILWHPQMWSASQA